MQRTIRENMSLDSVDKNFYHGFITIKAECWILNCFDYIVFRFSKKFFAAYGLKIKSIKFGEIVLEYDSDPDFYSFYYKAKNLSFEFPGYKIIVFGYNQKDRHSFELLMPRKGGDFLISSEYNDDFEDYMFKNHPEISLEEYCQFDE